MFVSLPFTHQVRDLSCSHFAFSSLSLLQHFTDTLLYRHEQHTPVDHKCVVLPSHFAFSSFLSIQPFTDTPLYRHKQYPAGEHECVIVPFTFTSSRVSHSFDTSLMHLFYRHGHMRIKEAFRCTNKADRRTSAKADFFHTNLKVDNIRTVCCFTPSTCTTIPTYVRIPP